MSLKVLSKPTNQWLIGLVLIATTISSGIAFYGISHFGEVTGTSTSKSVETPPVKKVAALGRLEPEAEVIQLSAPLDLDGDRITQLLVKEGDVVKAGQVVAILNSRDQLRDALQQAQQQVNLAQAKLAQVKAGAKSGEIVAQQSTINRLEAELAGEVAAQNAIIARWQSEVRNARTEHNRFQQLFQQGAISASSLDSKRLVAETAQAQLEQAKKIQIKTVNTFKSQLREARATLSRIAEIRPVDIRVAQTEVENATALAKRAETNLSQAYIKAPTAGRILKIHTRTGEKIRDAGIADLAQTEQMVAVAEVYQTDIEKVKIGQQAVITSRALTGKLRGVVSHIGLQVKRQNIYSNQPGENLDRRVIEVKIRLRPEDSRRVAGLTNLQVQTVIQL